MDMNQQQIDMSKLTTAQCPAQGCEETAFYQLFDQICPYSDLL